MQLLNWFAAQDAELLSAIATFLAVVVALALPVASAATRWLTRPKLEIEFTNAPRCRRQSPVDYSGSVALFFRVKVTNTGRRPTKATGRLIEVLHADGTPDLAFDPVALHWAGTDLGRFEGAGSIELLPGQSEYLDVVKVPEGSDHVEFILQDATPRGVPERCTIAGQLLRVTVEGAGADGAGIELRLPQAPPHDPEISLVLDHRRLRAWSHELFDWLVEPAPEAPRERVAFHVRHDGVPVKGTVRYYSFGAQVRVFRAGRPWLIEHWQVLQTEPQIEQHIVAVRGAYSLLGLPDVEDDASD